MQRKWKVRSAAIATALTLVAVGGVLEFTVREVLRWPNYFAYNRRSIRLYEHIPNEDRVYRRPATQYGGAAELVNVRTDSDGFLLPDMHDPTKPVDLTIAFLGGSTTESLWVQEDLR